MRRARHRFAVGASRLLPDSVTKLGSALLRHAQPRTKQELLGSVSRRLFFETLEPRLLLSADLLPIQGSIAVPGETDHRAFAVMEDAHVLLEAQTSGQLNWTLDGPHGNVISSQSAAASDPVGKSTSSPLDLVSGNYTLSIQGVANATGTYQFQLLDLASAATATPDVQPAASTPAAPAVGGQPTQMDPQPPLPTQGASASSTVVAPQSPDAAGAAVTNLQQIVFQPNQGQANSPVAFTATDGDYTLYVMKDGGAVQLVSGSDVLQVTALGANPNPTIVELDQQLGVTNSNASDLADSATGVPGYGRIQMADVYAGIDLTFHANAGALEYDWIVNPGADASAINLQFTGATRMELDAQGDLIVHTAHGELIEQAPQLYQNIDGAQRAVSGSFTIDRAGIVGLQVGDYDHALPLVIDPVLGYSTYVGGSGDDIISGMASTRRPGTRTCWGPSTPPTTRRRAASTPVHRRHSCRSSTRRASSSGLTLSAMPDTSSSTALWASTRTATHLAAASQWARTAASM
jgi:hypothetical protein